MFLLTITAIYLGVVSSNPEVDLPLGRIQGHYLKTYNNKKLSAFEGVPYAKAPIGDLRFEEPQPIEPWNGTLLVNKIHVCLQYDHYSAAQGYVKGDEDCLRLNVYTSGVKGNTSKDVIVYIHGGAFMFGNGGMYGPFLLLDNDVVYITLNYRLGPLGFLSTENEVVPGNNGLKDQVLAFKWIKENVKYFGGNPDSITITGMSAGGASVQLHALSPLSKGLFNRGISQSGCVLNPWVLVEKSRQKSQILASHLGCPTDNTVEMIRCLKTKPGYDIVKAVKVFMPWLYNPISPFGVVIDVWSPNPFLSEHPYTLLKKGKVADVPWLFSHVKSEGLYPGSEFISKSEYLKEINNNWDNLIPHILDFNHTISLKHRAEALKQIRDFYFHDDPVNEATFSNLITMMSDRLFLYGIYYAIQMHSDAVQSSVYNYYFTYRGAHSKSEYLSKSNKDFGASHADDTSYVLSSSIDTRTTESDRNMSEVLIKLWLSFASKSIPEVEGVEWLPVQKQENSNYMNTLIIASAYNKKMDKLSFGNLEFWDSILMKENQNLYIKHDEL